MQDRVLIQGNEAVGWGALAAGCDGFFGYPITPQNEITEFFAREMPKRGKVFVQSESELGSIMMLYGGAGAGFRVMTSTSSPGWGLMQEGMSNLAAAELPCVVVLVQRGGPGQGSIRHAQMDYRSATRGGGGGGYRNIVLAPASAQEAHDLVQLAFHLADKYCNPVVLLTDGILGQTVETVELNPMDFGPLPEKDWAARGTDRQKDGRKRYVHSSPAAVPSRVCEEYIPYLAHLNEKYREAERTEVRYEGYRLEGARLALVAFGYVSRVCMEAVDRARAEGREVGLIRPITLWPFPYRPVKDAASAGCRLLVVEDNLGQMEEDVRLAVGGLAEIRTLGMLDRHLQGDGGMILPGRVLEEIRRLT